MYYWNLTPGGDTPPTDFGTDLRGNQGLFTSIRPSYWSGTEFDANLFAWGSDFFSGSQGSEVSKDVGRAAWAVRPGDTIPEPGTMVLLGSELVGVGGLRWLWRPRK